MPRARTHTRTHTRTPNLHIHIHASITMVTLERTLRTAGGGMTATATDDLESRGGERRYNCRAPRRSFVCARYYTHTHSRTRINYKSWARSAYSVPYARQLWPISRPSSLRGRVAEARARLGRRRRWRPRTNILRKSTIVYNIIHCSSPYHRHASLRMLYYNIVARHCSSITRLEMYKLSHLWKIVKYQDVFLAKNTKCYLENLRNHPIVRLRKHLISISLSYYVSYITYRYLYFLE